MWRRGPRGNSATCLATHKQIGPFWCWFPGRWFCVHSRALWVSPLNSPVRMGVSPTASTPHRFFQSEVLMLYFPTLDPWVVQSVSVPCCSSWVICTWMWDHLVRQTLPCPVCQPLPWCKSSLPSYLPLPLLPGWMNVSFLISWLSDFHTVQFSGSSGCFLFLNLLLSFFWLCEEAQCIYIGLYLVQKSLIATFLIRSSSK